MHAPQSRYLLLHVPPHQAHQHHRQHQQSVHYHLQPEIANQLRALVEEEFVDQVDGQY